MLFICTFTWAHTVCPCTAEAPAVSARSKGTKTIKKRKKRRKKQKLSPEIGKFQSTNKHKREVMWICIVVSKTLYWWLAVFTHATFFKQCSSPVTERDQELKTILLDTLYSWFLTQNLTDFYQDCFYLNEWKQEHCRETSHRASVSRTFPFLKKSSVAYVHIFCTCIKYFLEALFLILL